MTEQEKRFSEYERQKAIQAVIKTNAVITDEEFHKLAKVIGSEVEVQIQERHVIDEMSGRPRFLHWTFVLKDFNFVVNPRGQRVLAFLRETEGNTIHFPYKTLRDYSSYRWTTYHDTRIKKVVDVDRDETIWSYDQYGEPIMGGSYGIGGFSNSSEGLLHPSLNLLEAIEASSTSYSDSTR